jgi:hypothetical protein
MRTKLLSTALSPSFLAKIHPHDFTKTHKKKAAPRPRPASQRCSKMRAARSIGDLRDVVRAVKARGA